MIAAITLLQRCQTACDAAAQSHYNLPRCIFVQNCVGQPTLIVQLARAECSYVAYADSGGDGYCRYNFVSGEDAMTEEQYTEGVTCLVRALPLVPLRSCSGISLC